MQRMLSMKINDETLAKFVIHPMLGVVAELRAHRAAADVEADRDAGLLRGRPDRVPVPVGERRLAVVLRLVAEVHRPVAELDAALQLGDREVDVPERQRGDREQPVGVGAAPVGEEVVVGAHALARRARGRRGAGSSRSRTRPRSGRAPGAWMPCSSRNAQARVGVVHRRGDVVEGLRDRHRHDAVPAGHGVVAGCAEAFAARHPHVVAVDALDVRHLVVHRRGHAGRPHVGGLGEVGVDVDDGDAVEEVGAHDLALRVRGVGCR